MKKNKLNFTLKVIKNGKVIQRCQTHSKRRFLTHLRTINWQDKGILVYVRVSYGKKICNKGCLCTFYNDGFYDNRNELEKAIKAFMEED